VTNRFVLLYGCALDVEGAWLDLERAESAAVGTGLLRAHRLRLLLQGSREGALGESGGSGLGDLFHDGQIDVESWALVAEGAPGDDFAPLDGQCADFLEVLGGNFGACHRLSYLALAKSTRDAWFLPFYGKGFCLAKQVLASEGAGVVSGASS
jgi:hypothetical protein